MTTPTKRYDSTLNKADYISKFGDAAYLERLAGQRAGHARRMMNNEYRAKRRILNREMSRRRMARDPERVKREWRDLKLRRVYGITSQRYAEIFAAQDGRCPICKRPAEEVPYQRLGVDHNHKTGEVRGLLCAPCNSAIGLLGESQETLMAAIAYVANYSRTGFS